MKKILLQSLAVVFGFVMGGAAGGYLTYARQPAIVRYFFFAGIFDSVSESQYDKNSADAKQELVSTLGLYTQGVQSSSIDPGMKNALRMKCGLIEARLSILENEAGNTNQAKVYMSKAQEDLKAVGWVDPSEANILQAVKRQPVSPCGIAPQDAAKTIAPTPQKPCD